LSEVSKNKRTGLTITMLVLGMFAFAYAAFPLYNLFCKVTGYGGTTQVSEASSGELGQREFTIRFNADTNQGLPWDFVASQKSMKVTSGENKLAFYTAENISDEPVTGVATYNVTPAKAGVYFNKVQCFCFENQTLKPGEKIDMPVSFFVDPEIEKDPNLKNVKTITLSYTFFPSVNKE
jgi:cytochrome c oxidase assembly protein subunit 11